MEEAGRLASNKEDQFPCFVGPTPLVIEGRQHLAYAL